MGIWASAMMAIKMMMVMMTLEHPVLPRATRPILNSIRMWEEVPHMTWKALLNMTMRNWGYRGRTIEIWQID